MTDENKKNKIPEKNRTIYADLQKLAILVNKLVMGMPRRHRPTLASKMLSACIDSLVSYRIAYKFIECREKYKSEFLVEYSKFKELIHIAHSMKALNEKDYIAVFEYVAAIDSGFEKWNRATKRRGVIHDGGNSNDDSAAGINTSRGGDGFI